MRHLQALAISAALVASGCSVLSGGFSSDGSSRDRGSFNPSEQHAGQWLRDGSVALSRPVPSSEVLDLSVELEIDPVLGFMPSQKTEVKAARQGNWLRINRSARKLELMNGGDSTLSISGDGVQALQPGTYKIMHKQETPLWYAPDAYFEVRDLDLPSNNENERYRRGALGTAAVFLDQDTPIHNGPIWREEIGGVRVDDKAMNALFAALPIGAVVEIR